MAADLKSTSLFHRISILLEPDCLVRFEHGSTRDRVRKLMFDRVETLEVWRNVPVLRLFFSALLLGTPAGLLVLASATDRDGSDQTFFVVMALIFLALLALLWTIYLYCGTTTIRIVRDRKAEDIKGIFRPAKVRRFVTRLESNIRATQSAGFANLAQPQLEPQPQPAPPATP